MLVFSTKLFLLTVWVSGYSPQDTLYAVRPLGFWLYRRYCQELLTFLSSQTKGQDWQGLNPPLRNPSSGPEYIKNLFTNKTNCAKVGAFVVYSQNNRQKITLLTRFPWSIPAFQGFCTQLMESDSGLWILFNVMIGWLRIKFIQIIEIGKNQAYANGGKIKQKIG